MKRTKKLLNKHSIERETQKTAQVCGINKQSTIEHWTNERKKTTKQLKSIFEMEFVQIFDNSSSFTFDWCVSLISIMIFLDIFWL